MIIIELTIVRGFRKTSAVFAPAPLLANQHDQTWSTLADRRRTRDLCLRVKMKGRCRERSRREIDFLETKTTTGSGRKSRGWRNEMGGFKAKFVVLRRGDEITNYRCEEMIVKIWNYNLKNYDYALSFEIASKKSSEFSFKIKLLPSSISVMMKERAMAFEGGNEGDERKAGFDDNVSQLRSFGWRYQDSRTTSKEIDKSPVGSEGAFWTTLTWLFECKSDDGKVAWRWLKSVLGGEEEEEEEEDGQLGWTRGGEEAMDGRVGSLTRPRDGQPLLCSTMPWLGAIPSLIRVIVQELRLQLSSRLIRSVRELLDALSRRSAIMKSRDDDGGVTALGWLRRVGDDEMTSLCDRSQDEKRGWGEVRTLGGARMRMRLDERREVTSVLILWVVLELRLQLSSTLVSSNLKQKLYNASSLQLQLGLRYRARRNTKQNATRRNLPISLSLSVPCGLRRVASARSPSSAIQRNFMLDLPPPTDAKRRHHFLLFPRSVSASSSLPPSSSSFSSSFLLPSFPSFTFSGVQNINMNDPRALRSEDGDGILQIDSVGVGTSRKTSEFGGGKMGS
ncbi:hypothetical protein SCHPADRAFT_931912, partial [Schizopora paradoxa]